MEVTDDRRMPGQVQRLAPGLDCLIAPNPSAMTERGTNTYVLGQDSLCIIDPGPDDPGHLAALLAHVGGRSVSHIIVTHSHLDHSGLAGALSRATQAPVLGLGDSGVGRSAAMQAFARTDRTGGGEGADPGFAPDIVVADGAVIQGVDWALRVIATPGHFGNHICLRWQDAIFSGDHVMGWASTMISPPDGDVTDYMASCARVLAEAARVLYPGHGAGVTDPPGRIGWLMAHRRGREAQILAALSDGPRSVADLTSALYTEVPAVLRLAAARNVLAHLIDLAGKNLVRADPALHSAATFRLG